MEFWKLSLVGGCAGVKYRNTPTNGYVSKREARRATDLKLLEKAGQITRLQEQVPFVLAPAVMLDGKKKPALRYVADFVYEEEGQRIVEDAKGVRTRDYRIKRHLMKSVLGIEVREV